MRLRCAEVALTVTEFDLLAHLMRRPGRVYSREQLLSEVWGYASVAGTRTVDVHIAQIRAKLGAPAQYEPSAASAMRSRRRAGDPVAEALWRCASPCSASQSLSSRPSSLGASPSGWSAKRMIGPRNNSWPVSADAAQTFADAPGNPTAGEVRARNLLRALKIQFATIDGAGHVVSASRMARDALTQNEIADVLAENSLSSRAHGGWPVRARRGPSTNAGAIVLVQRRADAVAVGDAALRRLVVALAIAVGIAVLLGLVVAWRLARPLKRTAAAAHALTSRPARRRRSRRRARRRFARCPTR